MKRLLSWGLVLALWTVAAAVAAEEAPVTGEDPGLEAMRAIGFMEGTWQGEGWMRFGPGEPETFTSRETVESRLDGRVLIVEGLHHSTSSGDVVHHALATISFDASNGKYRFDSHLASGRSGVHVGELVDGTFVWGMQIPDRGRLRYTITIDGDSWHEIGEFSADGNEWHQNFQMDLVRVADE